MPANVAARLERTATFPKESCMRLLRQPLHVSECSPYHELNPSPSFRFRREWASSLRVCNFRYGIQNCAERQNWLRDRYSLALLCIGFAAYLKHLDEGNLQSAT